MTVTMRMTGTPAAHWRVLNHLYYANMNGASRCAGRYRASRIIDSQGVGLDDLCEMDRNSLIDAWWVERAVFLPNIHDRQLANVDISLGRLGLSRVVNTAENNVVCMIGHQPRRTATVKAIRTEAYVDDVVLFELFNAGLINAIGAHIMPIEELGVLPEDLRLTLTNKGREYLPR